MAGWRNGAAPSHHRDQLDDAARRSYLPGMRRHVLFMLSVLLAGSATAGAQPAGEGRLGPSSDRVVRPALPEDRAKNLDAAFQALAEAKSPREAHGPEQRILAAFNRSGSDTVDLLMGWANQAFVAKNYPEALDLLDQILILRPEFAEGYNRRATVYYALDDYRRSLADIRRTLVLEPRHFGALTGLASILTEIGDKDRAREIYLKILAVHPNLENAKTGLEKLDAETEGEAT
jgi:tetratricopeptide (TPR) repeat protein